MLEIGSFLSDRYEILSKVGAGGMSDVYKAKDHILSRFVAIKVLKQEFSEDSSFVTKFRAEAQSAAGLEHPNIVNIYDVGSENVCTTLSWSMSRVSHLRLISRKRASCHSRSLQVLQSRWQGA